MDRFSETFTFNCISPSNVCDHCKEEKMEDLRQVYEYRKGDNRFYACHECYDEIQNAIEHQAEEADRRARILRAERMYARLGGTLTCCNCKIADARWNSLYCSDSCKKSHMTFPEVA